jgi:hypothetical protein
MASMAQSRITSHRRQVVRIAAPAFAGLLLLGACGKKDEPAASSSGQSSSGTSVTTKAGGSSDTTAKSTGSTPGTATKGSTVDNTALNQTVWYMGFKLTLGALTYDKTEEAWLIETEVENLGSGDATFYGSNLTISDGSTQVTSVRVTESPTILAKSKAKTKLQFELDGKTTNSDLKGLSLVMGNGDQQQVKVPLDGSSSGVVTLKPIPQESVKGDLKVGEVTLTPTLAEVRFDEVNDHAQMEKGKAYFVITGKAKNNSSDTTFYLDKSTVSLALPDGTKQNADVFSSKDSLEATKTEEFTLGFIIPDPYAGEYTITFTPPWTATGDPTDVSVKVTLVKASSGTTSGTTPGSTPGTTKK